MKVKSLPIMMFVVLSIMTACGNKNADTTAVEETVAANTETTNDTNKKVMEQFVTFINTGDTVLGKEIISPDVIFYAPTSPDPLTGFQGYVDVLNMMRGAMPDVQWKPEEVIAEGDKVVIRFTMTGTQSNPFMGMPATNKPVSVTAMNIYELRDGKIVRENGVPDLFSMLLQLGMIPAPGQQ